MASLVLLLGAVFLVAFPESIGEADIVFMAGMATLMDFWQLIFALALACLAGMALFVVQGWKRAHSDLVLRLPFLPLLALGGSIVLGVWI